MTQLPNFLVTTVEADTICHSTAQPQFIQRQINLLAYAKQAEKGLILYFYPKDNTSGCSVQAQDFSQHLTHLQRLATKSLAYQEIVSKAMKNLSPTNRLILRW